MTSRTCVGLTGQAVGRAVEAVGTRRKCEDQTGLAVGRLEEAVGLAGLV
jgi:hypothetical protein